MFTATINTQRHKSKQWDILRFQYFLSFFSGSYYILFCGNRPLLKNAD